MPETMPEAIKEISNPTYVSESGRLTCALETTLKVISRQ